MSPRELTQLVRRRWWVVAAASVLGMIGTYLLGSALGGSAPVAPGYESQLYVGITAGDPRNPRNPGPLVAAELAAEPEVEEIAAERLGDRTSVQDVAANTAVQIDIPTQSLLVTASAPTADRANALAGAFGGAIAQYLETVQNQTVAVIPKSADTPADRELKALAERIAVLGEATATEDPRAANQAAVAELAAAQARYAQLYAFLHERDLPLTGGLSASPVGVPTAERAVGGGGLAISGLPLLLLGLVLGLVLGLALVVGLDRLDRRLRSREEIEEAYGLPVLAELPAAPRGRTGEVTVVTRPDSARAESFRGLRSAVLLADTSGPEFDFRQRLAARSPELTVPRVMAVMSARSGEGRSTAVANLAAALSEAGRTVLVIDADVRHPSMHRYLGVAQGTGLSDLLHAPDDADAAEVIRPTVVPGVRLMSSGTSMMSRGALLVGMPRVLEQARPYAHLILIDTSPLLASTDAADLLPHVDAVLMIAAEGKVTAEAAAQARIVLDRAAVPLLGLGLTLSSARGANENGGRIGRVEPWQYRAAAGGPAGPAEVGAATEWPSGPIHDRGTVR